MFKVTEGTDGRKKLIVNSLYPEECCDFALANDIRCLDLYPGYYTHTNLEPILSLNNFLEGLILNEKVDFSELRQFTNLKFLGALDNKKNILNLECFPALETLACTITERLKGLETCKNLKNLTFSYYNPKSKDITALPTLSSVRHLSIIKTSIATLQGIEKFSELGKLEIYGAPKLEKIAPLQNLSGCLEEVAFESCKKIGDYETLGKMQLLKKIMLTDSGEMKTLSFVKSLHDLKLISFVGTNVLDGDINYSEGIKYVGFDNKRHYNHRMNDFNKGGTH